MGLPSSAPPTVVLVRVMPLEVLVLVLVLLQIHMQMPGGFLAPSSPRAEGEMLTVRSNSIIRPPPAAPGPIAGVATSATVAASEAEATGGHTANCIGGETASRSGSEDDSHGDGAEAAGGAGRDSSFSVLSEFVPFVERRKSAARRVVLDVRSAEEFCREHLEGSTSIPINELEPRLLELPPPFAQPVSIVGTQEDRRTASEFLTKKGWQIDAEIGTDLVVAAGVDDEAEAWPTEAGSTSVQVWRANDFLEFCTERFLLPSALSDRDAGTNTSPGDERGVALDLGCGSGRDAVYLAQHLPPGTRVVGVDNHSYALDRGAMLAARWLEDSSLPESGVLGGVEGAEKEEDGAARPNEGIKGNSGLEERAGRQSSRASERSSGDNPPSGSGGSSGAQRRRSCEWLLADLRKEGSLEGLRASVIHGHRFKCEQLLPVLRDDVLVPGGFFIWSTFLDTGTENAVPPWRPSRMMRRGELASIFSGDEFEILVDEQGELPTRGSVVPANFFACRKKPLTE